MKEAIIILFAKKINIKLIIIASIFMIIFILANSFFVDSILDKSIELTCNVYHNQISSRIDEEIDLLKISTEKIANDNKIINILDENRSFEELSREESELILTEINAFEGVLKSSSFVKTINIASLSGEYLFSNGVVYENFDFTERPWFNKGLLNSNSKTIITDMHKDYSTNLETIAIISFIYSDDNELLGAAVLDIFVKDLLKYSNTSFYSGDLNTYILKNNEILYSEDGEIKDNKYINNHNNYYISNNKDYLGNGNYLLFSFNKFSIKNNPYMKLVIESTTIILFAIGIFISIALVVAIRLAFKPALKSIEKLRYILNYLDEGKISFENKDEFKQLEIISDSLGKSFDKKVQSLIYYDELTNLPNRKQLKIICNELIDSKTKFALVFIDLNKFKIINDVYGHLVGDQLLVKFSNIMKNALNDKGIITRYSGDEFVIVYKDFKDDLEFMHYYKSEILSKFKKPIEINKDVKTFIDFSTGVAVYPRDGLDVDELINKSDFMMYKNKKDNINHQILFFNDDTYMDMLYIETIKNELTYVCERNELILEFQPIYDEYKKVKKAEALLRWNSKKLGFIRPDKFINYAEETRDIIKIGYWVIEEVCRYIKNNNWNIEISINVSPIQLMEINFDKNVKKIIEKYNVSYNKLCFEITESVILENNDTVFKNIESFRMKGIKIALDDFGTGYASFNYLTKYSLDILKIDKVLLDNASQNDFEIINHIKKISNILNMKVIIEGVETESQFKKLKEIKCDLFQGYYLSRPLGNEEFSKLLENIDY
ncbi:bifunctional diguanylate cyclase/phosphodiesterase [Romboutsia sp. Marseille-P6047]|uniref:bifunctional diguanylate cyclase/phosphodiesterase n=1 Tax=Romboutsia sp. Marseille-P6047 TaxID=2161817 RepID=UPI000F05E9F4|nr:EAL domain-containing protein [Romboutsia sp. Marseille-P6047]